MLKYLLAVLMLLHGCIHFMGLAKAFQWAAIPQLTKDISKPAGLLWLLAGLLFILAALLFLMHKGLWWLPAAAGVLLSQILIVGSWKDAKWGTAANVIVLLAAVAAYGQYQFYRQYVNDVDHCLRRTALTAADMITENDLQPLPAPVQRYLRYAGVLNKPRVYSMKAVFEGQMRSRKQNWFQFTSQQYNFFDNYTRLFFMKGRMKGIEVPGYHAYQDGTASMHIKLFGLFSIVRQQGPVMFKTETVTMFNDMCLMAPATLIDKRIQWQAVNDTSVHAVFTNNGVSIGATLYFNGEGQLVNFISADRTDVNENKQYQFSTPVKDYRNFNGIKLAACGEGVWHYADGPFIYGKFNLKEVEYNPLSGK